MSDEPVTAESKAVVTAAISNEIPGTADALKKMGWVVVVAIVGAVANTLPSLIPALQVFAVAHLPLLVQDYGKTLVSTIVLAVVGALAKWASADTKRAVSNAYVSEPSPDVQDKIKAMYKGTGDGNLK